MPAAPPPSIELPPSPPPVRSPRPPRPDAPAGHPAKPPRRPSRRRKKPLARRLKDWRKALKRQGKRFRRLPSTLRWSMVAILLLAVFAAGDLAYQVVRKPSELFFPVSGRFNKLPAETWREYGGLFRRYSTAAIPPELLAALAQTEAAGNPLARTYWRWQWSWDPFSVYRPASSAVGLYQMTDANFTDARRFCIDGHTAVEDPAGEGPCWANGLYARVVPAHAIELTAAFLDRTVASILARRPHGKATPQQIQDTAVIAHLCGQGPARAFARRGFHLKPGERCGDHSAAAYLTEVNAMKRQFQKLAAAEK